MKGRAGVGIARIGMSYADELRLPIDRWCRCPAPDRSPISLPMAFTAAAFRLAERVTPKTGLLTSPVNPCRPGGDQLGGTALLVQLPLRCSEQPDSERAAWRLQHERR